MEMFAASETQEPLYEEGTMGPPLDSQRGRETSVLQPVELNATSISMSRKPSLPSSPQEGMQPCQHLNFFAQVDPARAGSRPPDSRIIHLFVLF